MLDKIVDSVKDALEQTRRRYLLHKTGYATWDQYQHIHDPDVVWRATKITNFYHGYPYIYCFENVNNRIYDWDFISRDGIYIATEWCKKNLKDKFRFDHLRVMRAPSTAWEWEINELGGGDYIFFACKDSKDLTRFLLKWT